MSNKNQKPYNYNNQQSSQGYPPQRQNNRRGFPQYPPDIPYDPECEPVSGQVNHKRRRFTQDPLDYSSVNVGDGGIENSIRNQNQIVRKMAKPIILENLEANSNSAFSPLSLNILLSFVAAGSAGKTLDQFLSFLKSKSIDELNTLSSKLVTSVLADGSRLGGPRLSCANGAWIDQSTSFTPDFKKVADDVYKAQANQADFRHKPEEERIGVNKWAEKETKGLIKDLIPPRAVDEDTRLILANALYFKGAWKIKFNESLTKVHDFYLLDGSRIKAPFMTSRDKQYISEYDDFKVLRLPYQTGRGMGRMFSMYVYLPDAKNGLRSLVERISSEPDFLERYSAYETVEVGDFRIPKFKISFTLEAKKLLEGLGLDLPFQPGGLTNMVESEESEKLKVTAIFHKAFAEVNEEGTEAAAATAFLIGVPMGCSAPLVYRRLDFITDHPFVFLIKEEITGAVLFMGSVVNPVM